MYQYRSPSGSRRKKGISQIILPFLIILLLVGIVWAAWSLISRMRDGENRSRSDQFVQVMIDSGSVKGMMENQDTWTDMKTASFELYPGEKVKVGPDGQASVIYSSQMELRLNRSAEMELSEFEEKEGQYTAVTELNQGLAWASLGSLANSNSTFTLNTDHLSVTADSANFAVQAPGTVYMLEGQGSVDIKDSEGELVKSVNLGVGQQLIIDESVIADIKAGNDEELILALDDEFKRSSFYLWNAEEEGWKVAGEDSSSEEEDNNETDADDSENGSGEEDSNEDELEDESEEDEPETSDEPVVKGEVKITAPSENADHERNTMTFTVEAKVPGNTAKVVVNGGYTLGQYKAGNTVARYYVSEKNGNVSKGKNTYTVVAYDKNNNEIGKDSITVNVTADSSTEQEPSTPDTTDTTSSGAVTITSPSGNAAYESSTNTFDVKAAVPENTAKVEVNGYALSRYSAGGTSATYYVKPANSNVSEGENTYTVKAYDKDGKVIGSDSITVTVKTGSEATPDTTTPTTPPADPSSLSLNFSFPSGGGTYSTNLSPIDVGGSVSADIRNLYVNDTPLASHALGNTTWKYTMNLQPGLNTIKVYGESETNDSTGVKTLTIDYQGQ